MFLALVHQRSQVMLLEAVQHEDHRNRAQVVFGSLMEVEHGHSQLAILSVAFRVFEETIGKGKLVFEIFFRHFPDFRKIEFSTACQLVLSVIVEHYALSLDVGIKVSALVERFVQLADAFVDELRTGRYFPGSVGVESTENIRINRMFVVPHAFLGNDEQVVIAHEIGLYPVFDPLVVIDVGPACVTAV